MRGKINASSTLNSTHAVDHNGLIGKVVSLDLPEPQSNPIIPRRKHKWLLRLLVAGVMLATLVLWLNGPGIRWLGPWAADRYLQKLGIEARFQIDGTLTGGISVRDISIRGPAIPVEITCSKLTPGYQFSKVLHGKLDGITIDQLHVVIDVDKKSPKKIADNDPKPFDPQRLADILRTVRTHTTPLDIRLSSLRLDVRRGPAPLFKLAPSSLTHTRNSSDYMIYLGEITDPQQRIWPAQQSSLRWTDELLHIDSIDPLPNIGLRDLTWNIPPNSPTSADARLLIDDAAFSLETGPLFQDLRLNLLEGNLDIASVFARFGIKPPIKGSISSLSFNGAWLDGKPEGEIRLLAEKIDYQGWQAEELNLDGQLDAQSVRLLAKGLSLGSPVTLEATAPITRLDGLTLGDVSGKLNIADIPAAWSGLSQKLPALRPHADIPASSLESIFRIRMQENKFVGISGELNLLPLDPAQAAPLAATASWEPDKPLDATLKTDGLHASATIDFTKHDYRTRLAFDKFQKSRINPWLSLANIRFDGDTTLTGQLHSEGNLSSAHHKGSLDITQGTWTHDEHQTIHATGRIDFQWPGAVKITALHARSGDQDISLNGELSDGTLQIPLLTFREKDRHLLDASLRLPVPADPTRWKETIARDKRPIQINIESRALALQTLHHWLPQLAQLDPTSTGLVKVDVSGTYAEPDIRSTVELKSLRLANQADLPPADVSLDLRGQSGKLDVTGRILTPGYDPAILKAHTDFLPAAWAENPELWKQAAIEARVDLPRVRLSRFLPLIPKVERLDGTLNGHARVSGTFEKPSLTGNLRLTEGLVQPNQQIYPAIHGIAADIDLGLDRIQIKSMRASAAGGNLTISGGVPIVAGKPGPLDITVKGDHLLVRRDDKLVVRANADLRITGLIDASTISGTINVVDSLFYRDLEIIPVGLPFIGPTAASLPKLDAPARAIPSLPAPFASWKLALQLRTGTPFLIRGTLGNGTITGDVKIGGSLANPEPHGEVLLNEASLALPYTTLRVRRGTVRFTGSLDPTLEIRGMAEPRPYQVFLYLYGNASNPELLLTSSPPLPQNEIISLLATGATPAGLEDSKVATSRALQLLAEEVRRGRVNIARPLRPLLSLVDRVDFTLADEDPYTGSRFSTTTLSLTDRWLLAASMGDDGETRVMAIWKLSFR
jgi:TamB, inner membrane protein subunit of TAM complex